MLVSFFKIAVEIVLAIPPLSISILELDIPVVITRGPSSEVIYGDIFRAITMPKLNSIYILFTLGLVVHAVP